jgi:hypothetical protein
MPIMPKLLGILYYSSTALSTNLFNFNVLPEAARETPASLFKATLKSFGGSSIIALLAVCGPVNTFRGIIASAGLGREDVVNVSYPVDTLLICHNETYPFAGNAAEANANSY